MRADLLLSGASPQIYLIPEGAEADADADVEFGRGGSDSRDEEVWAAAPSASSSVDEYEIGAGVSYAELRDGGSSVDAVAPARAYGLVDSTGGIQ